MNIDAKMCLDENVALALIEGDLADRARLRVERHIACCDPCRELVAELARADDPLETSTIDMRGINGCPSSLATVPQLFVGSRVGPYRIDAAIGSGSTGIVYRATDVRSGAVIALKHVVEPALLARFRREASTLARLDHPAIVRYIGHGDTTAGMYLAMEWLVGEDLQARLCRSALGWEAARILGIRIAGALAHAHAVGCVHRDLSPRNVFLPGGIVARAKLLDFGLVRVVDDAPLERTRTHAVLGTPYYMSPEQIRDPTKVDARSDLFSLGVVLHEALRGARPFEGEDLFTLWGRIVEAPAPSLIDTGAPAALVTLIDALLAKEPEQRPPSAVAAMHALSSINATIPPSSSAVTLAPAAPPLPPLALSFVRR